MRIRTKLLSGFLIVVALLFASVVTNGWSLTQLDRASATVQKEADRAAAAQQVARAASDMARPRLSRSRRPEKPKPRRRRLDRARSWPVPSAAPRPSEPEGNALVLK